MTDPALKNYIKTTLAQGYSPSAIRARLKQAGYQDYNINTALKEITGKRTINTKTIAILAGIIVILIIATIIGIKLLTPTPKQIDMTTTPLISTVVPGGKLTFITTLTSSTSRQVKTSISHNAVYTKTNQNIAGKTEQITIGQKSSIETQITLPENAPSGEYTLITNLGHADGQEQSRFNFLVETRKTTTTQPATEQPTPTCPLGCDDYNKCTIDRCENGTCTHEQIIPCCGNGICETDETNYCTIDCKKTTKTTQQAITEAVATARTDINQATMLCNAMPSATDADTCFETIATETRKSETCQSIQDSTTKDKCLINFALQGNYDVCEQINDAYYIKSCLTLQQQSELQNMAKQYS